MLGIFKAAYFYTQETEKKYSAAPDSAQVIEPPFIAFSNCIREQNNWNHE
jgi:hypothetical protein